MMGVMDVMKGTDGLMENTMERYLINLLFRDDEMPPLVRNIVTIVLGLKKEQIIVCIVNILSTRFPSGIGRGKIRQLRLKLEQVVRETNEAEGVGGGYLIQYMCHWGRIIG